MFIDFARANWTPEKVIGYTLADILKHETECNSYLTNKRKYIECFVRNNTNACQFYSHMALPLDVDVLQMIHYRLCEALRCSSVNKKLLQKIENN